MKKKIDKFVDYEYSTRGKSRGWCKMIRVYLRKFEEYLELNNLDYSQIKIPEAMTFKKSLVESDKKYSSCYINGILITTKLFYRYLVSNRYTFVNPFEYIKILRVEEKVIKDLPKEKELFDIFSKLSRFYEETNLYKIISRLKIYVVAELMYSTGIRISEASLIKEADIDFNRGIIKITDLKTKKERYVFLNEYCLKLLKLFVDKRETLSCRKNKSKYKDYLFSCCTNQLNIVFNQVLLDVLGKKLTSHKLRHCFGYHLLKRGCDIFFIKHFLGHASIDNTQIYTKIDKEDLKNILKTNHPRKFKR